MHIVFNLESVLHDNELIHAGLGDEFVRMKLLEVLYLKCQNDNMRNCTRGEFDMWDNGLLAFKWCDVQAQILLTENNAADNHYCKSICGACNPYN